VLRLPGTGVLVGRVVDRETDQPIAGAEVLIALNEGQGGMRMGMPDFSKVLLTDGVGGFRVEGIGPSSLASIAVRAEGYEQLVLNRMFPSDRALWTRVEKTAIDPAGETALPALALGRGRELSGTIADRAGATPIEGAAVELWDFVMGSRATTTDATGRYHFTGVGDRVALVVSAPGYAPFRDPPFPGFSLPEGQEDARRDVELEPAGVVEGRVRGASGEPVPHALVRLQAEMRGPAGWLNALGTGDLYAWTGDDGNYRIEGVPPIELRAEAQAPGYDRASSEAKTLAAGARLSGLDLTLLAAARLEGRVLDRGGRPVAGARVTVSRRATADDPGVRWRALAEGVSAFTGDDGRFAVAEVPVGDLDLRVEAEGFAIRTIARAGIEPGADIRNVAIELEPAFTIRGAVRDAQGRPVTWCWVRATRSGAPEGDAGNGLLGARVEPDGTFELRGLPEGLYRIDVVVGNWMPEATRYQNAQIENVAAGTEDLRVVLVAAAEGGAGGG
jgi:protocatechuate 3,4-dioxygenase beta subunit